MLSQQDLYQETVEAEKRNIADIIIAKQRNGPVGEVCLRFDPSRTCFHDLETTPGEQEGER